MAQTEIKKHQLISHGRNPTKDYSIKHIAHRQSMPQMLITLENNYQTGKNPVALAIQP